MLCRDIYRLNIHQVSHSTALAEVWISLREPLPSYIPTNIK